MGERAWDEVRSWPRAIGPVRSRLVHGVHHTCHRHPAHLFDVVILARVVCVPWMCVPRVLRAVPGRHFETSSNSGQNVQEMFMHLFTQVFQKYWPSKGVKKGRSRRQR